MFLISFLGILLTKFGERGFLKRQGEILSRFDLLTLTFNAFKILALSELLSLIKPVIIGFMALYLEFFLHKFSTRKVLPI